MPSAPMGMLTASVADEDMKERESVKKITEKLVHKRKQVFFDAV